MKPSKRKSTADWQKLIEEQSKSDQSVADFCKSHELSPGYFYKRRAVLKKKVSPGFTKLRVAPQQKSPGHIRCVLANGTRLEWDECVSTDRIVSLLRSLA